MQYKRAFTLIELLVVIAIIAILAAILFPVFAQAKKQAKGAADLSNVKQEGLALLMYSNDVDDVYPFGLSSGWYPDGWVTICQPYVKNLQIYRSPLETSTATPWGTWTGTAVSYASNSYMIPLGADVKNSATLASWCAPAAFNATEPVSCILRGIMSWTAQVSGQQNSGNSGGMMNTAALTTTEVTLPANTIALAVRFNGDALAQNPGSPGNVTQFQCGGTLHSLPATNGSWLGNNEDWCGGGEIPNGKRAVDLLSSHGRYGAVSQIRDNGKSNFVLCDGHAKLLDIGATNPDPDTRWDLNMWDALR